MQFPEADFGAGLPIDSIGPGFFRVEGKVLHGPILIHAGGVSGWGGLGDAEAIAALAGSVDLVFIGTGAGVAPLPAPLKHALAAAGLMFDAMGTGAAARSYNHTLVEGRRIAAALLPLPEAGA
ncbi:Mth938-like domain-containing protein [Phaeovulum sp.]|uniref:Mth938-like domain-containing protein n=1 Tax=Phaeovulum sp. TaxID=2934796 RepID=UPI00272F8FFB|nr:Mth938-like domain-containing protein [Phaeovulum sp.]MDP1667653.1 Mth938-like domain-containing protein [Phaeovulum sp.]MDZ4118456.1 Mth938-like domain-containing protein [Phaeovulum sp.]